MFREPLVLSGITMLFSLLRLTSAQIQAPLSDYHAGCNSLGLSRSPDCMAAFHRYCTYNNYGGAGYPQEVGTTGFGFLCANTVWYGDVAYGDIPLCSGATQSAACYSSAHRYCNNIGHVGVGIVQELGSGVVGLACVPYSWYGNIDISLLRAQHPGCTSPTLAQGSDCIAAVHRYCSENGLGQGGVIPEIQQYTVDVACISSGTYKTDRVTGVN